MAKREATWILSNLAFEEGVILKLYQCGVPAISFELSLKNFMRTDAEKLSELELDFLEDTLYLIANLASKVEIAVEY